MVRFETDFPRYDYDAVSARDSAIRRLAREKMDEHYGGDGWTADDVDYDEALMYRRFWNEANDELSVTDTSVEEVQP